MHEYVSCFHYRIHLATDIVYRQTFTEEVHKVMNIKDVSWSVRINIALGWTMIGHINKSPV